MQFTMLEIVDLGTPLRTWRSYCTHFRSSRSSCTRLLIASFNSKSITTLVHVAVLIYVLIIAGYYTQVVHVAELLGFLKLLICRGGTAMNRAEWQRICKEEAEWALSQVIQLTKAGRIRWNLDSFFPAELMHTNKKNSAYIIQQFEVSSFWNGSKLLFSSYSRIHIPSGRGDIGISFIYARGSRTYSFALSMDDRYEETPTESLLEIYSESLIVQSCDTVFYSLEGINSVYTINDLFSFQGFSLSIRRNGLVHLSMRLVEEKRFFDFQKIILDTHYRALLKDQYQLSL